MEALISPPDTGSSFESLHKDLNALSHRAIQANVRDLAEALELAQVFKQWTSRAVENCGEWSETFRQQSEEMIRDLKSGVPVAKAMEQLLRVLLQAHRLLEKEQKGEIEKETDSPTLSRSSKTQASTVSRDHLYVRPEDQGLFQMFLQEAPTLLSGIQSNLLLLSAGQKADLPRVLQIFYVLKGQWGFLGFYQMKQLSEQSLALLEPFTRSTQTLSGNAIDILLRVLGCCRSQVDRIARGAGKNQVEIWDAGEVLNEVKAQVLLSIASISKISPVEEEVLVSDAFALVEENFFRVQDSQMEGLLEILGNLMISQSSLLEESLAAGIQGKNATEAARILKLTRQLRDQFLAFRMVSAQPLFDQMNRFVRQLSKTTGKKVSFVMEGGESEIDKSLLFQLASPLEQLLRNALDHGIETPEERLAMGKAPEGLLRLKASHQAGSFLLEVEDDGSGLDMEKLRQKGADLGIFSAGEKVNPVRVMEMIFKPGVTTVENPSAGQGAGLDQVEEKMEDLHGSIRVQSRAGQGCKFVLKIPRTQALIEGLVVEAGQKKYLMPLSQVRKISHPTPLKAEDEKEVSRAAGPAPVELAQFLGEERRPGVAQFTLHVESGSHQAQVLVDEVHGKQQVLVKKMDEEGKKTGLRGAVVLADGKLGWILDMRLLVQSAGQDERRKEDSHGKSDQK